MPSGTAAARRRHTVKIYYKVGKNEQRKTSKHDHRAPSYDICQRSPATLLPGSVTLPKEKEATAERMLLYWVVVLSSYSCLPSAPIKFSHCVHYNLGPFFVLHILRLYSPVRYVITAMPLISFTSPFGWHDTNVADECLV